MKVSINSIKTLNRRYDCTADIAPDGTAELAVKVGAQLGGIEEIIDIGSRYQGIIIVTVIACDKHPNADKLNVCLVDDGGTTADVERNDNGYVQVVCGAPNVRAGLTVAWLPPGSTVPESVGPGKEPFVLEARSLRGIVSNGMLASQRELALGDNHEGILELEDAVAPGTDFAEHYGLAGDVVFDIENKMFTHRPDCFGFLGVAREMAGIQQLPFKSPGWYGSDAVIPDVETEPLELTVRNELPELVRRFTTVTMRDVEIKPSPVWLQVELSRLGMRPINNIVDYTNYFMLLTGQPLHAYDYDKVKALDGGNAATLVVRNPQAGEIIMLLNGKRLEPRSEAVMIATETSLIGVGGVMGGADTEVDDTTRNIIIEAANFDMYSIRRTSMAHGLFTDAVSRFNKGQSPLQNRAVIARIVDEIRRHAGGKVASPLIDDVYLPAEAVDRDSLYAPVEVTADFVNERLGSRLDPEQMAGLLANVEFRVNISGDRLTVTAPFWRTDIELPEDVVEEIGRLYGFDRLPLDLPRRSIDPVVVNPSLGLKQHIRTLLSTAGANEMLNYSFVHGRLLDAVGQRREDSYSLSNALSPDLQYYRQSLTPSLLDKVHANIKAGYDRFALFEIGKAHRKDQLDSEGLPREFERLALVFAADAKAAQAYSGAAYYQVRAYLDELLDRLRLDIPVTLHALQPEIASSAGLYEPGRSAIIMAGDSAIGEIGEYQSSVRKLLKLPDFCAGFELDINRLLETAGRQSGYQPLSRYPGVEQDICLKVPVTTPYQVLFDLVRDSLAEQQPEQSRFKLSPVDIYQRPKEPDFKQITLRVSVFSYLKTLRDAEITAILDSVTQTAARELSAERI